MIYDFPNSPSSKRDQSRTSEESRKSGVPVTFVAVSWILLLVSVAVGVDLGYTYATRSSLRTPEGAAVMTGMSQMPEAASLQGRAQPHEANNMPGESNPKAPTDSNAKAGSRGSSTKGFTAHNNPPMTLTVTADAAQVNDGPLFRTRILTACGIVLAFSVIAERIVESARRRTRKESEHTNE